MKIALFGVERRINNILKKLNNQPVHIVPYVYKNALEIKYMLKKIKDVDGFLFTGKYPYNIAKAYIEHEIPAGYIEFDESCFYVSLFNLPEVPQKISIDTIKTNVIKNIYKEYDIEIKKIFTTYLEDNITFDDIVNFHIKNHEKDSNVVIFTCLFSVYDILTKKGIPVILINHTYFSIQRGIENLLNKYYFYNSKSSYPAVGIIKIKNYQELLNKYKNEFKLQKFLLKFHEHIINFQEKVAGFFVERNEDTYIFISTRYLIEKYSNNYKDFPIIYEAFSKYNIKLDISIGYGLNPQTAYHNAKSTLSSIDKTKNNVVVSTETGKVIILSPSATINFDTIVTDDRIKEISQKTKIGITNLTKIKSFLIRKQTDNTTVYEISRELNITTRSGSRIINNLLKAGFAEEIGIEQPVKGRPRRIFRIKI